GARQADLDEMLKFHDPSPPVPPSSSQSILKSSQAVHLSDYERKEILDYPSVYCICANSEKKPAMPRNPPTTSATMVRAEIIWLSKMITILTAMKSLTLSENAHLVKYFSVAAMPPASQQPSRSSRARSVSIAGPHGDQDP
ncbi:hypothetical protein FRB90_001285, partial [Tulasnella sp. 427]